MCSIDILSIFDQERLENKSAKLTKGKTTQRRKVDDTVIATSC